MIDVDFRPTFIGNGDSLYETNHSQTRWKATYNRSIIKAQLSELKSYLTRQNPVHVTLILDIKEYTRIEWDENLQTNKQKTNFLNCLNLETCSWKPSSEMVTPYMEKQQSRSRRKATYNRLIIKAHLSELRIYPPVFI